LELEVEHISLSEYWHRFFESKEVIILSKVLEDSTTWLKQDLLLPAAQKLIDLYGMMELQGVTLEIPLSMVGNKTVAVHSRSSQFMNDYRMYLEPLLKRLELLLESGPLSNLLQFYHESHRYSNRWLEEAAEVVSNYCTLQEGPDPNSWIYTGSLFVKAHSESIMTFVGVVFALLCVDIVCSWSRSQKKKTKKEEVPKSSLLRKAKVLPPPRFSHSTGKDPLN
jgi:hypothetical protein